jgi:energy-coupling factor transport system ATP-binding protein
VCWPGSGRQAFSQVELLSAAYVEPPQLVRLARELGWESQPLTVEEFIQELGTFISK